MQQRIRVVLRSPPRIRLVMRQPPRLQIKMTVVPGGSAPTYRGPYEVTPSREQQTLATGGLRAAQDIIIAPIPSNYGLITYNGFEITVS